MSDGERPSTRRLGDRGEDLAVRHLKRQEGYRVVERNLRNSGGELDLVAWDGQTLCFVEIKLRRQLEYGGAAQAVDARKQERVRRAAEAYLQHWQGEVPECRFDVVTVEPTAGSSAEPGGRVEKRGWWRRSRSQKAWRVELFRDAF